MDGFVVDLSPPPAAGHEVVTYTLTGGQAGVIAILLLTAIVALAAVALTAPRGLARERDLP